MDLEQFFKSLEDEEITNIFSSPSLSANEPKDSYTPPSLPTNESQETFWTCDEDKLFENALADLDPNSPNFLTNMASRVFGKTIDDIKKHYDELIEDFKLIQFDEENKKHAKRKNVARIKKSSKAWSAEEHRAFLDGVMKYGEGNWKDIAKYCVLTRTKTQVASHAQKYFKRLDKMSSTSSTKCQGKCSTLTNDC